MRSSGPPTLARLTQIARKTALFLLIPALGAVSPLIALPAVTSRFGAPGWAVVAVGVSVGSTAAVVADLGWGIIGPQQIGRDRGSAKAVYASSLGSKVCALLLLAPVTVVVAALLSDSDRGAGMLIALGTLLNVLGPAWFFVGEGLPGRILWTDTVPRLVLTTTAALVILAGAPLSTYGIGAASCAIATFLLGSWVGRLPLLPPRSALRGGPTVLRAQLPLILGNIMSTAFTSAPAAILSVSTGPGTVALFSAVDRMLRIGLNILSGIPARLQSWLAVADRAEARRRSRNSVVINSVLGVIAGLTFFLVAPPVSSVLFTGSATVTPALAALGGLLAAQICASRGLGLALVAVGAANRIVTAIGAGAVVGILLLVLLPGRAAAEGALVALASAEGVMIAVQLLQLHVARAGRRQT